MTDLLSLDDLAKQIREDALRADKLRRALQWLDQAENDVVAAGAFVEVTPNRNRHDAGGHEASVEIARHYENLYPQAIALVREMCRHELERINARYLPLLMPVSQGSEG